MTALRSPSLTIKAKLFRGLADPSRLAILESLRSGEKMVSEVVSLTGLSQPNVSGHLIFLKDCGLLTSRQQGRCVIYALANPQMEVLMDAAERILASLSERISQCVNFECRTNQKCVSDRKCESSVRVAPLTLPRSAVGLPIHDVFLEGATHG
jgi:DNA-binding transcriptional ArsR family regulator